MIPFEFYAVTNGIPMTEMEPETSQKNGAKPKSHTSRANTQII